MKKLLQNGQHNYHFINRIIIRNPGENAVSGDKEQAITGF
jgi:hypothetical protein